MLTRQIHNEHNKRHWFNVIKLVAKNNSEYKKLWSTQVDGFI